MRSGQRALSGNADDIDKVFAVLDALGIASNLPTGFSQLQRTGKYLGSREFDRDIRQGDLPGVASGVIYGKRKRQPDNPLTPLTR